MKVLYCRTNVHENVITTFTNYDRKMKLDVLRRRQVIKSACRTFNDYECMRVMLIKVLLTTHLLLKLEFVEKKRTIN